MQGNKGSCLKHHHFLRFSLYFYHYPYIFSVPEKLGIQTWNLSLIYYVIVIQEKKWCTLSHFTETHIDTFYYQHVTGCQRTIHYNIFTQVLKFSFLFSVSSQSSSVLQQCWIAPEESHNTERVLPIHTAGTMMQHNSISFSPKDRNSSLEKKQPPPGMPRRHIVATN